MTPGARPMRGPVVPVSLVLLGLFSLCVVNRCQAFSYVPLGPEETYNPPAARVSLEEYLAHVHRLRATVADCTRAPSAASCDWKSVGPDDEVQTSSRLRKVQYTSLRVALKKASDASALPAVTKDAAARQSVLTTASDGLLDAAIQLDKQLAEQQAGLSEPRNVTVERTTLKNILASGGYTGEIPPTLFESLRDEFAEWLDKRLTAVGVREGSQLIVDLLLISLIVVACGAMIWWFARKVQHQPLMLPPSHAPDPSAPSYQDWQQWLDKGRAFAHERQWREAIHHVYWSAISRLESRGFWPADRARTPREYIGLLSARPESIGDLRNLTRSFERTWYGDQAVGEAEFDQACVLLERLAR